MVATQAENARVRLGEGSCFGCMTIRATLARMKRLDDHGIYKRIQWLAAQDSLIMDATLSQVEQELALEAD